MDLFSQKMWPEKQNQFRGKIVLTFWWQHISDIEESLQYDMHC